MSQHFNELSAAQAERLALLLEELGEAQQAIGKILRHGYESRHPDGGPTNRETLEREMGDVSAAFKLMEQAGELNEDRTMEHEARKLGKLGQYLHHAKVPSEMVPR